MSSCTTIISGDNKEISGEKLRIRVVVVETQQRFVLHITHDCTTDALMEKVHQVVGIPAELIHIQQCDISPWPLSTSVTSWLAAKRYCLRIQPRTKPIYRGVDGDDILVWVQQWSGKSVPIYCTEHCPVTQFKLLIQDKEGDSPPSQRLRYMKQGANFILDDREILSAYGITNESRIHRWHHGILRGGATPVPTVFGLDSSIASTWKNSRKGEGLLDLLRQYPQAVVADIQFHGDVTAYQQLICNHTHACTPDDIDVWFDNKILNGGTQVAGDTIFPSHFLFVCVNKPNLRAVLQQSQDWLPEPLLQLVMGYTRSIEDDEHLADLILPESSIL